MKNILKDKYKYDEETDSYLDITSAYSPIVSNFVKFWDTTIVSDCESGSELEIEELHILFNIYNKGGKWEQLMKLQLTKTLTLDLIQHFYPDTFIVGNKLIQQVRCTLWDKRMEVQHSLDLFKMKCLEQGNIESKTLADAFAYYMTYECYVATLRIIYIRKPYFDQVARELINQHIDIDGLIKKSWWNMV